MRGLSAKDTANGDQRVVLSACRKFLGSKRQFESARHPHNIHILARGAGSAECIHRSGKQPLGDEAVEPAHDDSEAQTIGLQPSIQFLRL